MPKSTRSEVISDYRLTASGYGLQIEVLDYHAEPLFVGNEDLRRLGLRVAREDRPVPVSDRGTRLAELLGRAIDDIERRRAEEARTLELLREIREALPSAGGVSSR